MKTVTRLFSLLAVAGLACTASATDTTVYFTGSTAYRQQTHQAILKYLKAQSVDAAANTANLTSDTANNAAGSKFGYVGANWRGAGSATFIRVFAVASGSFAIGDRLIVKTTWNGSEKGIQAVTDPTKTVTFLPASYDLTTDATLTATGTTSLTTTGGDVQPADACMSDTYQSNSIFTSPTLSEAKANGSLRAPVGVVPFFWVLQKIPAGSALLTNPITNISPNMIQSLYKNGGYTSAMLLSGSAAHAGIRIYALGRDIDSGTRVNAFAESGVGITQTVKQWRPNVVSGSVAAYSTVPGTNTYNYPASSKTLTLATGAVANIALGMVVTGPDIPVSVTGSDVIVGSINAAATPPTFTLIDSVTSADVLTTNVSTVTGTTGIAIAANGTLGQVAGAETSGTSASWGFYPGQTINGVATPTLGKGGENSGGTVAGYLGATSTDNQGYGIAYLGSGDTNTAIGTGATILSYDGVAITTSSFANIQNGTYKFWSLEHLFYNASTLAAIKQTVCDGIGTQIYTTDSQILQDANLKVKRSAKDGSTIIPNTTVSSGLNH